MAAVLRAQLAASPRTERVAPAESVLEALLLQARSRPTARALHSPQLSLSYAELLERTFESAEAFERSGFATAAVALDNGPAWVVADLAAQIANVTLVPLPAFFSPSQVAHVLATSGAEAIVIDAAAAPPAYPNAAASQRVRLGTGLSLLSLDPAGKGERTTLPAGTAKISYTSGTTGQPKGACLAQRTLDRVAGALCLATSELNLTRHLAVLPLATLLENVAGVYAPLMQGAEIMLPGLRALGFDGAARFDLDAFLRCLDRYAPQSLILLPQLLTSLVTACERGACLPESLRFIAVGGGCVPRSLLERADRLGLPVYEGYGLTECASVVTLNTPAARRRGSVGRPLAHVNVQIGTDSEIRVMGNAMLGYVGERAPAPQAIATGDIGHFDADGFLYIDGRRKNIFITSYGRNVSPEWVEAELVQQSAIGQAVVFGEARAENAAVIVPRGAAGAAVRDAAGVAAAIAAQIRQINARLPTYARIEHWVIAPEPFTAANGLATENGRNRRDALWHAYGPALERLWARAAATPVEAANSVSGADAFRTALSARGPGSHTKARTAIASHPKGPA